MRKPAVRAAALALAILVAVAADARAQGLPSEPISIAGGHFVLGLEAVATIGPDDPGFFNYTDYEYSALQNFRIGVSAEIRANDRVQLLTELRLDQGDVFEPYGLYVRIKPFASRSIYLQAGRVPPTFGAMARSAYGSSNLLIGQPLSYQYLVSLHTDAVPATVDDLLRMRGRGWESSFPVGNTTPGPGVPLVNTSRWDTGLQVHGVNGMFDWTGSVTTGSLSDPRVRDNNAGKHLAGRLVARPTAAFVLGVSVAHAEWIDRSVNSALEPGVTVDGARQAALGGDAEYSIGRVLIRSEVIRASWTLPKISTLALSEPLVVTSKLLEGRLKVLPGLYVALRGERLDFNTVMGSTRAASWEANTYRFEGGAGYSVTRNIQVKGAWQRNRRDGGRVRNDTLVSGQVLYWF